MKTLKNNNTRKIKLLNKLLMRIILACVISIPIYACSNTQQPKVDTFTFAIIGNTYPSSPFAGFTNRYPYLINEIRDENPTLLFHTGNIIQGGYDWMGIKESDVRRQCMMFRDELKDLASVTYTIVGTRDLLNESSLLYKKFFNKELYYSFNYGNIHFIILNTVLCKEFNPEQQLRWLRVNLDTFKDSQIIIFTHKPLFVPSRKTTGITYNDKIHEIIKNHKVLAVFSGSKKKYYEVKKDNILYITVGSYGLKKNDQWWLYNHYYLVSYSQGKLTINPKKSTFK